jgi:hypothetical protein
MNQPDLDLDAILARSQQAYGEVLDHYADDEAVPTAVREHFNYDVPNLVGLIRRLMTGDAYQVGLQHGRASIAGQVADGLNAHRIVEQARPEVRPWE